MNRPMSESEPNRLAASLQRVDVSLGRVGDKKAPPTVAAQQPQPTRPRQNWLG